MMLEDEKSPEQPNVRRRINKKIVLAIIIFDIIFLAGIIFFIIKFWPAKTDRVYLYPNVSFDRCALYSDVNSKKVCEAVTLAFVGYQDEAENICNELKDTPPNNFPHTRCKALVVARKNKDTAIETCNQITSNTTAKHYCALIVLNITGSNMTEYCDKVIDSEKSLCKILSLVISGNSVEALDYCERYAYNKTRCINFVKSYFNLT